MLISKFPSEFFQENMESAAERIEPKARNINTNKEVIIIYKIIEDGQEVILVNRKSIRDKFLQKGNKNVKFIANLKTPSSLKFVPL